MAVELRFERAIVLDRLDRPELAKSEYVKLLERAPQHFGAINNLAALLWRTDQRSAAYAMYIEAAKRHPENPVAHANLAFVYLKARELGSARHEYEIALRLDPANVETQRGHAAVLAQLGEAFAAATSAASTSAASTIVLPYRGETQTPIRLLALVTLGAGNIALEPLLDDRCMQTTKLVVELHGDMPLPAHDIVFNAIGDADSASAALVLALRLLSGGDGAVINHPERVIASGRAANARRFRDSHNVAVPRMELLPRSLLVSPEAPAALAARGFGFPLLVRSLGHHTGEFFERVDHPGLLAAIVAGLPGDDLLVIEYIDTRAADGSYAKFRMMFVDGRLLPLHLAISANWKVHYFSADMIERPDYRARDAAYLSDMHSVLGPGAIVALEHIRDVLGLDYGGIDFGLDADGRVVLFEANATMIVVTPGSDERWAYRRAPVDRVVTTTRAMIERYAQRRHAVMTQR